jgi:hypothetical protein
MMPSNVYRKGSAMNYIELQGLRVPALGFGTWTVTGADCVAAVRRALEIGYRHIDTAANYSNEAEVGQAIRDSGVPREEIFLTTKVARENLALYNCRRISYNRRHPTDPQQGNYRSAMIQIKRRRLLSLALGAIVGWASKGWVSTAAANTIELAQAAAKLTKIGDIRDIRRSGFGTPPDRRRVQVNTRDAVYRNEVMETVAGGAMRIRFGDATSLRIGSESLVTLDEYVYAPYKRTSKMMLTMSKGVFRFVTGKMAKRSYRILTPTATIGVRGTDFLVAVTDTSTEIDLYEGEIEVEDTRGADAPAPVTVSAGQKVTVSAASTTPSIGVAQAPADPALAGNVVDEDDEGNGVTEGLGGEGGESGGGCFPAGTKITMADGSLQSIEDVKVDDMILAFDFDTNRTTPARVGELMAPVREGFYVLNDGLLRLTDNHPVFVMKDGREHWASLNPHMTMRETSLQNVQLLEEGDEVLVLDVLMLEEVELNSPGEAGQDALSTRFARIEKIDYVEGELQTYNLKSVAGLHNFFADGVLVHNKHDG